MKSVPAILVLLLASAAPLAAQNVFDGPDPGVDHDFQTSTTEIHVSWNFPSAYDNISWRVGTTLGAGDVFSQTGLPPTPTFTSATGLSLVPGRQYFVTVEAFLGVTPVDSGTSDGIVVVAPLAPVPLSGAAPLAVQFTVPEYEGVVLYEWDFVEQGIEGIFDTQVVGTKGGTYSFVYTTPGQYLPLLRLTHASGSTQWFQLGELDSRVIDVGPPATPAPSGGIGAPSLTGPAPFTVTFTAQTSTFDGTVVAYLWDFDSDGTFDFSSETSNQATHTYTASGQYTPRVTVLDARGATAVLGLPSPGFVDVTAPTTPAPAVGAPTIVTAPPHRIGDPILFEVSISSGAGSPMTRLAWDFDGDGEPDFFDELGPLSGSTIRTATWRPSRPGEDIKARATVFNTDGLSSFGETDYDVELQPTAFRAWLVQPDENRRVWGDFVTLAASAVAPGYDLRVRFLWRDAQTPAAPLQRAAVAEFEGQASPPDSVLFPAGSEFVGYHWNVTGLPSMPMGTQLFAEITPEPPAGSSLPAQPAVLSPMTIIFVDSDTTDPDVLVENHGSPFTKLKLQAISLTGISTVSILEDTSWQFAPGTVSSYEQMRLERRGENPFPVETTLGGLRFVPNRFRRDGFQSGQPLLKPAKLTVYLAPANADVLADGTDLKTSRFMLFKFNPARQRWEPLVNQSYDANQKVAKALVTSGGDLALAVLDHAPVGGSSSGCGMLGLEGLPVLLLVLNRLRRRA